MSETNAGSDSGGKVPESVGPNPDPPKTDVGGIQKRDLDPSQISKKGGHAGKAEE